MAHALREDSADSGEGEGLVLHAGGCHCGAGAENLTTYTFNTHVAKHTFCKTCGVQSFYTPRSNPDGYGVAPHCLDKGTVRSVTVESFCGENWEESMQKHTTIKSMSKQ